MQPDYVTLVRWEPWEQDGHDCWRCTINTGHGELSWTTRYGPGENAVTVEHLTRVLSLAESNPLLVGRVAQPYTDDEREAADRLRAALDAAKAETEEA